jgi:drug/metabolite transporter (DMT)-like permease
MARLSLPGLFQPGLAYACSFIGLKLIDSVSIETMVWSAEGILMLPFSVVFLGERVSAATVGLACVALFGVALVTLPVGLTVPSLGSIPGTALIVAAVVAACWYTVLARRDLRRYDPLLLTGLHQISGLALILVLRAVWPLSNDGSVVSAAGILEAIAAGVCLFSAPFWLYLRSLQLLGASKAAQFLTIEPVLAVPLALTFLGEVFTTTQVVGSAITIVAMFAMARRTMAGEVSAAAGC